MKYVMRARLRPSQSLFPQRDRGGFPAILLSRSPQKSAPASRWQGTGGTRGQPREMRDAEQPSSLPSAW